MDKRSLILRTAIVLFAEMEFRNATILNIAKVANVPESLLYYYFVSKEDILFSIFLSFWQDFNYQVEKKLFLGRVQKPSKKLRTIIKLLKSNLAKDKFSLSLAKVLKEPLLFCEKKSFSAEQKMIEKLKAIKSEKQKFLSLLDRIIAEGQKDKNDNPAVIRQALYGACQMLFYGLFLKVVRKEKAGYDIKEAENFINQLISLFVI